ncbi:MAG TPA: hypothetical protein VF283_13755 [Bryobacteraceae bacterium]
MKPTTKTRMLLGIASLIMVAGSLGTQAAAQDLAGSFTLSSQVHWQTAILPPGTYTFTMDRSGPLGQLAISQGTKTVAFVVLQGSSDASTHDKSLMQIVDYRVRSLHLAPLGATYFFPGHKNEREFIARGPRTKIVAEIPVSVK